MSGVNLLSQLKRIMKLSMLILIFTILLIPSLAFSQTTQFTKIILKRSGGGFGGSTYQIEISSTGLVRYHGYDFVKELGIRNSKIQKKIILQLQASIRASQFFSLRNRYLNKADGCSDDISDMDWATTTIITPKTKKTVRHYLGCNGESSSLKELEEQIDLVVNSKQWVGKSEEWKLSPDLINALQKLERTTKRMVP
jgi:hypothetical protein